VTAQQREPWYWRWIVGSLQGGIGHFTHPVHEEITHRIYDCDADGEYCADVDIEFAPQQVLYGVRWNDVKPYVECIFAVENFDRQATAGDGFQ
jgi:hypothetical protein